jgi:translocation and assembly module TamA
VRISSQSKVWFALLASVLWLGTPGPAGAFELFGIKLFGGDEADADAEPIGEPQPYGVEFSVAPDDGGIEATLQGASTLWKDRDEPASGSAGLIAKAKGDYRTILNALYATGRYGGSISITIDGREAADLAPDAAMAETAAVAVRIDPGPLFTFGEARIDNPAPPAAERGDRVDDPRDEGFAPGEVARSPVIVKAGRLATEAWRQQGHAKARIAEQRITAAHDRQEVDATLVVEPGRRASYGPVTVEGEEHMDPAFVAWMTGLEPGDEYDPDDLTRASDRLNRLDVFRAVRLQEADLIGDDGLLPIAVILQERPLRRFGVGGSYSSVDGFGVEAFWLHRNLFGKAERLRVEAKVAGIGADVGSSRGGSSRFDPADFTYRVGASFVKPGVYTPDTDFVANLYGDREVLEPYTRTAVTGEAGLTHLFTETLSGRVLLNGGRSRFDDDFGRRDFMHAGILGGLTLDTRENRTDPKGGIFAEILVDPFYEFEYGNFTSRFTAEGRTYFAFGEDSPIVLAGRLKIGSVVGAPVSEVAPDKLFFAGGGGSVRGYAYRNIGIVSPTGGVAGGRSLIEGSLELRARITETIGVVAFADAGYVGADSFPRFNEDLRIGVGAGLRYLTGFGPIRLDVGVPLDPRPGDPDFAFYVGIGQAF